MNQKTIAIAKAAIQIYAETHPRPPHVTQTQAAEMLGVSVAARDIWHRFARYLAQ